MSIGPTSLNRLNQGVRFGQQDEQPKGFAELLGRTADVDTVETTQKTQPEPTKARVEKTKEPSRGKKYLLKSAAFTAVGLGLLAAPFLIPTGAGAAGVVGMFLMSIPFIIAKDMLNDYAANQGVKDYSDVVVVKNVLDENIQSFMAGWLDKVPNFLMSQEKKAKVLDKWMMTYHRLTSPFLDKLDQEHAIPELRDLPKKLDEKDSSFGKMGVLMAATYAVLKKASIRSAPRVLAKIRRRGGFVGIAATALWLVFKLAGGEKKAAQYDEQFSNQQRQWQQSNPFNRPENRQVEQGEGTATNS